MLLSLIQCLEPWRQLKSPSKKFSSSLVMVKFLLISVIQSFKNCFIGDTIYAKELCLSQQHKYITIGFWCRAIHKKILRRFDTSFVIKMMMKICAIEIIFKSYEPFQSYQLTTWPNQPFWLNWLGQLAGNSERAHGI